MLLMAGDSLTHMGDAGPLGGWLPGGGNAGGEYMGGSREGPAGEIHRTDAEPEGTTELPAALPLRVRIAEETTGGRAKNG
jgi:hypothetical protein